MKDHLSRVCPRLPRRSGRLVERPVRADLDVSISLGSGPVAEAVNIDRTGTPLLRDHGSMPEDEQPLDGGNSTPEIVRVGNTVRRAAGPWTPFVHQFLNHLADRSYPAPRPLGMDEKGREILSFIPGDRVHPNNPALVASSRGLRRVGRLIADYHRAQEGFVAPVDAVWRREGRDPTGADEVLAHNDLAPWILVAGPTDWVFIDWDLLAPGRRVWDLAWAVHSFVGLWPESELDDATVVQHIAAFCDGAEVGHGARPELLDVVVERTRDHAELLRRGASVGVHHFAQLVADGHADRWEGAAQHVEARKELWCSLLHN